MTLSSHIPDNKAECERALDVFLEKRNKLQLSAQLAEEDDNSARSAEEDDDSTRLAEEDDDERNDEPDVNLTATRTDVNKTDKNVHKEPDENAAQIELKSDAVQKKDQG